LGQSEALTGPCDAVMLAQFVRDENLAAAMKLLTRNEPHNLAAALSELRPCSAINTDQTYGEAVALGRDGSKTVVDGVS
jgi:hypothetical protein